MVVLKYILIVLEVLTSIALTILVLTQSSDEADLGAIAGSAGTYMNKDKGSTIEKLGEKYTKWVALAWGVLALALVIVLKLAG